MSEVKFKGATKQEKLALLKPKEKDDCKEKGPPKTTGTAYTGKPGEANLTRGQLTGAFAMVDPIQTPIGPIGQWILSPENLPLHPSILIYGKRRTGKSYTARWILFNCFRDYDFGIVCTGTYYNGFWQKYVPGFLVFEGLNDRALTMLIHRQIKRIEDWMEEHPNGDYKTEKSLRAFIVLGKQSRHRHRCFFYFCVFFSKKLHDDFANFFWHPLVNDVRAMPRPECVANLVNNGCSHFQLHCILYVNLQSNNTFLLIR